MGLFSRAAWRTFAFACCLVLLFTSISPSSADEGDIYSCENAQYDFVFVIDSSGSIGQGWGCGNNVCWNQMLEFIKRFLNHPRVTISPSKSRAAMIRFGTSNYGYYEGVTVDVNLNDPRASDLNALTAAVGRLPYAAGYTPTSRAIDEARNVFRNNNQHPGATKIMVVLTDGYHTSSWDPCPTSSYARAEGINIIAVGINGYRYSELKCMSGADDRIIAVSDFNVLANVLDNLLSKICTVVPRNGAWSAWTTSSCSATCGDGIQNWIRWCDNPTPNNAGQKCGVTGQDDVTEEMHNGKMTQKQTKLHTCNVDPCPINCEVGPWSEWTACTPGCDGKSPTVAGTRTKTRSVSVQPQFGGQACPTLTQTEGCSSTCAVDCIMGEWTDWSCDASSHCDGANSQANGTQTRTRQAERQPANNGTECPTPTRENDTCSYDHCEQSCRFLAWSEWAPALVCEPSDVGTVPSVTGTQTRTRVLDNPLNKECGNMGNFLNETEVHTVLCDVDCRQEWRNWADCTSKCADIDKGTQTRIRVDLQQPYKNGKKCNETRTETRVCEPLISEECPVNCQVSDWAEWSPCNYTCIAGVPDATGTKNRSRTITMPPAYNGTDCPPLEDLQSCTVTSCPVDCVQTEWSSWSICFCGVEVEHNRTRNTVTNATNGGIPCGETWETQNCSLGSCIAPPIVVPPNNTPKIVGGAVGAAAAAGLAGLGVLLWARRNHLANIATMRAFEQDALFNTAAAGNNPLFSSPTQEVLNPAYSAEIDAPPSTGSMHQL